MVIISLPYATRRDFHDAKGDIIDVSATAARLSRVSQAYFYYGDAVFSPLRTGRNLITASK